MFYHVDPGLVTGGFIGVDIFFVISGYLITGIIVNGIQSGGFSLTDFYIRRCRRILPALFTMLAVILGLGWVVLLPSEFKDLGKETLAGVTFLENALLFNEAGYFDIEAVRKPLMHLWSLAIEEQFYALWPLILLLACRFRIKMHVVSFTLFCASFAFGAYYFTVNPVAAFYILPSRFWEILSGACLFHMESHFPNFARGRVFKNCKAFVAVAILFVFSFLFYAFLFGQENIVSLTWVAFPCLAAMLLVSAGQDAWLNRRILSSPPLVFIGRISYPLYLWHWPLLSIAWILEDEQPILAIRLGAVLLALILAWLTFRFIERPVRSTSSPFYHARFVGFSALAAAFIIGVLGYYSAFSQSGFLSTSWGANTLQFDDMDQANVQNILDGELWIKSQTVDTSCTKSSWKPPHMVARFCRLTSNSPHIAILGDSHANHLVPGLVSLNDPDFSSIVEIDFGCAFEQVGVAHLLLPAKANFDCFYANEYFFDKVINDNNIKHVIISMLMYEGSALFMRKGQFDTMSDADKDTAPNMTLYRGLLRTIESLEKAGKQVTFFIDVPHMDFDPRRCLNLRRFSITSHIPMLCARPLKEVLEKQENMRRLVMALAARHPKMKIFDPIPAMCDKTYCYAIRDKKLLYRDYNHLSLDGSIFVAKAFMASMKK